MVQSELHFTVVVAEGQTHWYNYYQGIWRVASSAVSFVVRVTIFYLNSKGTSKLRQIK